MSHSYLELIYYLLRRHHRCLIPLHFPRVERVHRRQQGVRGQRVYAAGHQTVIVTGPAGGRRRSTASASAGLGLTFTVKVSHPPPRRSIRGRAPSRSACVPCGAFPSGPSASSAARSALLCRVLNRDFFCRIFRYNPHLVICF